MGIDFSHHFAETADKMKQLGRLEYEAHIQGDIRETREAALPAGAIPDRVSFQQGDACDLQPSLGAFLYYLALDEQVLTKLVYSTVM